jgi:hypothetical protein
LARVLARRECVTLTLAPGASAPAGAGVDRRRPTTDGQDEAEVGAVGGRSAAVGAKRLPADHPRLRDVTRALAAAYPALVGPVLTADGALGPGTLFSLDGRAVTEDLSTPLPEPDPEDEGQTRGARLLLLTSLEGGRR